MNSVPHNHSELHHLIDHGSHLLYLENLNQGEKFYQAIGFVTIFSDPLVRIMRLKHIYLELWNNQSCAVPLEPAKSKHAALHRSIIIEVRTLQALQSIKDLLGARQIPLESYNEDDHSPLGANIKLQDPDGNMIIFSAARSWSSQSAYEYACAKQTITQLADHEH